METWQKDIRTSLRVKFETIWASKWHDCVQPTKFKKIHEPTMAVQKNLKREGKKKSSILQKNAN